MRRQLSCMQQLKTIGSDSRLGFPLLYIFFRTAGAPYQYSAVFVLSAKLYSEKREACYGFFLDAIGRLRGRGGPERHAGCEPVSTGRFERGWRICFRRSQSCVVVQLRASQNDRAAAWTLAHQNRD